MAVMAQECGTWFRKYFKFSKRKRSILGFVSRPCSSTTQCNPLSALRLRTSDRSLQSVRSELMCEALTAGYKVVNIADEKRDTLT